MAQIRVIIGEREGEYRTALKDVTTVQAAAGGAAFGASVGSLFGGVGGAIGGAIGGIAGGVFGLGKPKRHTIRHILRTTFNDTLVSQAPSKIQRAYSGETKGPSDAVTLKGEYPTEEIRKIVDGIFKGLISQLQPGTDAYIDITNARNSVRYVKGSGGTAVLIFNEAVYHGGNSGHVSDGVGDSVNGRTHDGGISGGDGQLGTGGNRPNQPRRVAEPGLVFGLSPVAIGAAVVGIILLRS